VSTIGPRPLRFVATRVREPRGDCSASFTWEGDDWAKFPRESEIGAFKFDDTTLFIVHSQKAHYLYVNLM